MKFYLLKSTGSSYNYEPSNGDILYSALSDLVTEWDCCLIKHKKELEDYYGVLIEFVNRADISDIINSIVLGVREMTPEDIDIRIKYLEIITRKSINGR